MKWTCIHFFSFSFHRSARQPLWIKNQDINCKLRIFYSITLFNNQYTKYFLINWKRISMWIRLHTTAQSLVGSINIKEQWKKANLCTTHHGIDSSFENKFFPSRQSMPFEYLKKYSGSKNRNWKNRTENKWPLQKEWALVNCKFRGGSGRG